MSRWLGRAAGGDGSSEEWYETPDGIPTTPTAQTTLPCPFGAHQSMPLQSPPPRPPRPSLAPIAPTAPIPICRTCVRSCASYIWRLRSPDVFFALRRPLPRPGFRLGKTSSPPTTCLPPSSSPNTISPDASRARRSVRLSSTARAAASMKREASSRSMSSSPPRKFIRSRGGSQQPARTLRQLLAVFTKSTHAEIGFSCYLKKSVAFLRSRFGLSVQFICCLRLLVATADQAFSIFERRPSACGAAMARN